MHPPTDDRPAPRQLVPLGDRVLVRPEVAPTMTAGGLHIPEVAKEAPARGVVLAVGPDAARAPYALVTQSMVSPGDVVLHGHFSGVAVEHEGETLLLVRAADLMAVVR